MRTGYKTRTHLLKIRILIHSDDLTLVVRTAALAYAMRHHELAALRALDKVHRAHLPVRSSLIPVALGRFILRTNRHPETPPYLTKVNGRSREISDSA